MQRPQYEHTTHLSHITCQWHHCNLNDRHFKVKTMRNFTPDNFNSMRSFVKLLSEEFELMSVTQLQHTQSVLTSDLQQHELWPPPQSHGPPEALWDFKHWRDLCAAWTVDQILSERTGIPPFMETYSTHTVSFPKTEEVKWLKNILQVTQNVPEYQKLLFYWCFHIVFLGCGYQYWFSSKESPVKCTVCD